MKIKWKMGECVGTGTFGKVFRALNCSNGKEFAVKVIEFDKSSFSEEEAVIKDMEVKGKKLKI